MAVITHCRRTATVRAETFCDLSVLQKHELERVRLACAALAASPHSARSAQVMDEFPATATKVRQAMDERIHSILPANHAAREAMAASKGRHRRSSASTAAGSLQQRISDRHIVQQLSDMQLQLSECLSRLQQLSAANG